MPLVCICSPKGGVGKTTLTANLAFSLARSGIKVLAIDFDVQNALRLHFGVPLTDGRGYVAQSAHSADWSQSVLTTGSNIFVLPYGDATEEQRIAFEHNLMHDPQFLLRGLNTLLNYPGLVIIADFPPGPGPALKAASALADLHLITLLADTASVSLLPQIENQRLTGSTLNQRLGYYFLLNQSDNRRNISRDVTAFMEQRLGERLLGVIHRDESVAEANASQQSIFDFSPVSAAAFDIELIGKKVASLLNVQVGTGEVYTPV
ncbi:cellulose synthase operon protein YhjQ [Erwinia sp. OLTSP20]|uniref:cellulose biosynthesis protein BcsQ n=1 Tax=unclassified Erwinia TaxID=2622719 RepID=UPI000C186FC7|nr:MULTISPECIES: cellulose biosynthesis protein BcsQ [unclassified Erwinia]PIJ50743.1 cellulose synthase operon protein YhjQ [Erwinia sp. OAMSP11]PIJ75412.1 cellulose synthase operon protein YhjQ [Erwinia sp. OLSSP12]PIJ81910.1 cellulose synthase operon protein YhjQ [Erwinia sp. OLCASP19]PIJ84565.1 cellulose synthase operon protein YhjQ [Erwinia sp. OLMTSP26]PIJ86912.1 cellulose synthase operon protein YhjQ [Erwinia sp. OLMDSP33]